MGKLADTHKIRDTGNETLKPLEAPSRQDAEFLGSMGTFSVNSDCWRKDK